MKNYANPFSKKVTPKRPNRNETVPINVIDTTDFSITSKRDLRCNNPGSWNITVQYQLVGLNDIHNAKYGTINGWFILNGTDVPNSDASASLTRKHSSNVLVVSGVVELAKNDVISFGVRSTSDDCLNTVCKGFDSASGVYAPSVIITMFKIA